VSSGQALAPRLSPWGLLVGGCALVVGVAAIVLGAWSIASSKQRQVSYVVRGQLSGMVLDLGDADVTVVGGGQRTSVAVEHVDRFAFGHGPVARRAVAGGMFTLRSRCPSTVLHGCSASYRVIVPDNLPLTVRTGEGAVALRGYQGSATVTSGRGDITVSGYCGFSLQARAEAGGDIAAATTCPPQQLRLRTTSGAVNAQVPAGRYRIDASTSGGKPAIRGIAADSAAPFSVQALSGSGPVVVERAP
jgi:hypothetical protein